MQHHRWLDRYDTCVDTALGQALMRLLVDYNTHRVHQATPFLDAGAREKAKTQNSRIREFCQGLERGHTPECMALAVPCMEWYVRNIRKSMGLDRDELLTDAVTIASLECSCHGMP
jgi:hypothetical protein